MSSLNNSPCVMMCGFNILRSNPALAPKEYKKFMIVSLNAHHTLCTYGVATVSS
jgi:hypothetical protein